MYVSGNSDGGIRTDEHNAANHVEDGQFTTFLPLTNEQEKDITDKGVTLERMYSLDIKAEDGSTLRVMKNRRNKIGRAHV